MPPSDVCLRRISVAVLKVVEFSYPLSQSLCEALHLLRPVARRLEGIANLLIRESPQQAAEPTRVRARDPLDDLAHASAIPVVACGRVQEERRAAVEVKIDELGRDALDEFRLRVTAGVALRPAEYAPGLAER